MTDARSHVIISVGKTEGSPGFSVVAPRTSPKIEFFDQLGTLISPTTHEHQADEGWHAVDKKVIAPVIAGGWEIGLCGMLDAQPSYLFDQAIDSTRLSS